MSPEKLIELKNVPIRFGDRDVLKEIDLTIYQGEAVVIIGPSGTGKSTILRIMAGLLTPDSGEVLIQGNVRTGLAEDDPSAPRIALVFQNSALFDSLTVEENVGFFLFENSALSHQNISQLVEEKLEMVGLPGIRGQYPAQLSGGMRKRVSFARAIMTNPENPQDNPEVILYDEPTAGLDPIASTVIENLVRRLQNIKGGCNTYVMVSHQDTTIRRTADRVVFLYDGRIQWQGEVSEIDTTDNPMVQQFFQASTQGPIRLVD